MKKDFVCGFGVEYRNGNAGIQPICWGNGKERPIPLLLNESDIQKSEKLLNDLNQTLSDDVRFDLFTLMVTGAIVTAMKYGS